MQPVRNAVENPCGSRIFQLGEISVLRRRCWKPAEHTKAASLGISRTWVWERVLTQSSSPIDVPGAPAPVAKAQAGKQLCFISRGNTSKPPECFDFGKVFIPLKRKEAPLAWCKGPREAPQPTWASARWWEIGAATKGLVSPLAACHWWPGTGNGLLWPWVNRVSASKHSRIVGDFSLC